MLIYVLSGENGVTESQNLAWLKSLKAITGGEIVAKQRVFKFQGDTQNRNFDNPDDRDTAMFEAQSEFYPIEETSVVEPQPEGLNE